MEGGVSNGYLGEIISPNLGDRNNVNWQCVSVKGQNVLAVHAYYTLEATFLKKR